MSELDSTRPDDDASASPPVPVIVGPDALAPEHEAAVMRGAALLDGARRVIAVTGPGAVTCLQGVLTNDVERHGDRGFVYGALLTTKGMIVTDLWVARATGEILAIVPANGADAALETFHRYFPPRLARTSDRSEEVGVTELLGPRVVGLLQDGGTVLPAAGSAATTVIGDVEALAARPAQEAPFALLLVSRRADTPALHAALEHAGMLRVPADAGDLARVLAGWPRLGAEIGEKTLPQEVRYDEIDGVSYTKGCYTGQETVARVHFRGHANRWLAALVWPEAPQPGDATIREGGTIVGRVTSVVWSGAWNMWLGLALVRRHIASGAMVDACGAEARVLHLPLPTP